MVADDANVQVAERPAFVFDVDEYLGPLPDCAHLDHLAGRMLVRVGHEQLDLDGAGAVLVNRRAIDDYFPSATHRMIVTEPLRLTTLNETYDIDATMDGGGISGQAGALRLGIARGLVNIDEELRSTLKRAGFLTRDAREKESKKYGLKKARKAPQYSKR